jgi:hypothetical protein
MTSKSYKIIVTATDGKDTATATISLTVTDQNETPVFHQTEYSVEQDESSVSILVFRLRFFFLMKRFPFYVSLLTFLFNQVLPYGVICFLSLVRNLKPC